MRSVVRLHRSPYFYTHPLPNPFAAQAFCQISRDEIDAILQRSIVILYLSCYIQIWAEKWYPAQGIRPSHRSLGTSDQSICADARLRRVIDSDGTWLHVAGAEEGPGHGVCGTRSDSVVVCPVVEIERETMVRLALVSWRLQQSKM
jgi:hypothetical protein